MDDGKELAQNDNNSLHREEILYIHKQRLIPLICSTSLNPWTCILKENGMPIHIYKMMHTSMVNKKSTIEMRWWLHCPFTSRSGGVWRPAEQKFGKVRSIILGVICNQKVGKMFPIAEGVVPCRPKIHRHQQGWFDDQTKPQNLHHSSHMVIQNMPNHPILCKCGQHSLVCTHKFLGRYYDCHEFFARRSINFLAHGVCCIVAATPWAYPVCMARGRCKTTIGRNKFKGWAMTPRQSWQWYVCNSYLFYETSMW